MIVAFSYSYTIIHYDEKFSAWLFACHSCYLAQKNLWKENTSQCLYFSNPGNPISHTCSRLWKINAPLTRRVMYPPAFALGFDTSEILGRPSKKCAPSETHLFLRARAVRKRDDMLISHHPAAHPFLIQSFRAGSAAAATRSHALRVSRVALVREQISRQIMPLILTDGRKRVRRHSAKWNLWLAEQNWFGLPRVQKFVAWSHLNYLLEELNYTFHIQTF